MMQSGPLNPHRVPLTTDWAASCKPLEGKMKRFLISKNLPPAKKREGYKVEIVDSKHLSDGGPVAIAWFRSMEEARMALALVEEEK